MPKHEASEKSSGLILTGRIYDSLKFVAQILLPALGTLYFALAALWNLPNPEQVNGTILAVDAFLGVILGLSSAAYKNNDARFDGVLRVDNDPEADKKVFSLELSSHPDDLEDKKEITFRVAPTHPEIGG